MMLLYTEDPLRFAFSKDKIEIKDAPGYGILGDLSTVPPPINREAGTVLTL